MFKKLKDKIAEEVKQSPSKISATVSQFAQAVVSPSISSIVEPSSISDLNFSISEDGEEQMSSAKQGFTSVDLREESHTNAINTRRSRHSSTSSLVSDNASFFPHYEPYGSSFHLQSDLESASEMDDSYSAQATATSKEQLVGLLRKSQQRYNKYKGRYADLAKHYRELERDNYKAKTILSESQDKALRRIAELKEQCQLEQRAKAHLEEILRNDLEEKDHLIMTLNTKIDLLKLNDSPDSTLETSISSNPHAKLNSHPGDVQNTFSETLIDYSEQKDSSLNDCANEPVGADRDSVKKLEVLLAKCKDAIKIHKEKVKEYSIENEQLKSDSLASQESSSRQSKILEAAQTEIVWLKKREEESALSLAEAKRSIHSEMEVKEEQIKHLRQSIQDLNAQKEEMGIKCNKLEGQVSEMKQTQEVEKSSDSEKQIQELSRVKQEAMKILQSKYNETVSDLKTKFNKQIGELEKQIQDWTEKFKILQNESTSSQEQLEKQIKELTETNQHLHNNSVANQEQLEEKIKELSETNHLLQNNSAENQSQLEKQIKELMESNQHLQNSYASIQGEFEKQTKEFTDTNMLLQNTNASSQVQLKEYATSALALQNHIKQLEVENDSLQTKVRIAEVQATLNDNVSESKYMENMETLEIVIANLQESQSQLQTQYSALHKTLVEKENMIDHYQAESKRLLDNNSALSHINTRLDGEVQDLTAALSSANVCVSKIRIQLHETQQEQESVNNANQNEIKALADQLLPLNEKIYCLEKESEELKNCIAANEDSLLELRAQLSTSQEQLVNSKKSMDQVSALKLELEQELQERSSKMSNNHEETIREHKDLVQSLQLKVASTDAEMQSLALELASQKEEFAAQVHTLNIDNEKLTAQLGEKQTELSSQKEEFKKIQETITLNNSNLASQRAKEQDEFNRHKEELTEQINILSLNNRTLVSELAKKQAELSSQKEEFVTLKLSMHEDNVKLNSLLSEKQAELCSKTEELKAQEMLLNANDEKHNLLLAEKQSELIRLSEEFSAKENFLSCEKGQLESQLVENQAALTSQLNSLITYDEQCASIAANKQAEIDKISLKFSNLQEIIREASSEKDSLLSKLKENSEDLDTKSNELAELHKKLAVVGKAPEKLEIVTEQLTAANAKNRQLSELLEQNSVRHEELSEALASVNLNLETVKAEKQELEKELKIQASQGTDLSAVVKQFQDEKQQSCSQFEELQVKLESQEQDIDQLTQKLNECTVALNQRNIEFDENAELQRQKIKLLARNFEEKMHLREEELSKLFDEERAKLESTEGVAVNQLRTHIKALKSEIRQAEDTIANLNKQNKDLIKQQEAEIMELKEKIKDAALANEFEIRECEQKWRSSLEKELAERELMHKEEVNALSKEWSLERKTNNSSSEIPSLTQELESTSKVAVAAVESGTGSIDLMHRQLLSITRELNDAKRRHKLETVELRRIIENRSKGGETTELEYLRNILFEYMMGREPTVLARVIAAVLKFDQDQTNKIIEKEEHKQSLLGHLGIL